MNSIIISFEKAFISTAVEKTSDQIKSISFKATLLPMRQEVSV